MNFKIAHAKRILRVLGTIQRDVAKLRGSNPGLKVLNFRCRARVKLRVGGAHAHCGIFS